jgi:hypothetical protein
VAALTGAPGLLERAVGYALATAALATPQLLPLATPCEEWDLRALLLHVSDSLGVLAEAMRAGHVGLGPPPAPEPTADADPLACLRRRARALLRALAAAGAEGHLATAGAREHLAAGAGEHLATAGAEGHLATAGAGEHLVAVGDRELTVSMVAAAGAIEIAAHGWDISAACGIHRPVPPGLAAALLPIAPLLIPRATRAGLFADPLPVPEAACPGDRLVAFLGRRPRPGGSA